MFQRNRGRDRCLLTCKTSRYTENQQKLRNCFELQRTSGFIKPREARVLEGPHNMPVAFLIIINCQCVQFCHRHWKNLLLTARAVTQSLQWACSKNATLTRRGFCLRRTTGNLRCLLISCQTPTWNVNIEVKSATTISFVTNADEDVKWGDWDETYACVCIYVMSDQWGQKSFQNILYSATFYWYLVYHAKIILGKVFGLHILCNKTHNGPCYIILFSICY